MSTAMEKMEEYLESAEEMLSSSLSSFEFPNVREKMDQLWTDITRYGPSIPSIQQSGIGPLGDFEIPMPPHQSPLQPTFFEETWSWMERNPWKAGCLATGVVGGGLLVGYGGIYLRTVKARRTRTSAAERRQVVVILGGDSLFAPPLISQLEKKGYIVIVSVSNPDSVEVVERQSHGYVRALVLNPNLPEMVPVFLRSLSSTISRKFPLTTAGDPFVTHSAHPYIHSIISLLTLTAPGIHGPLEHLSLEESYLPYLTATQVVPLQVIQALLPLMRAVPYKGKKSIIFCLPATETRIGLPFSGIQSMSAAGTLRAAEVLRREIQVATMTGKSEFMKNIRVLVVDVGAFNVGGSLLYQPEDVYKLMEKWTTSEKLTYGAGFASVCIRATATPRSHWSAFMSMFKESSHYGVPRKPTDVKVFVDGLVGAVSNGRHVGPSLFGLNLGIGQVKSWLRGERFSIGAGASTYKFASFLPSLILEALLSLPHFLISVRNALLPTQPFVLLPPVDKLPPLATKVTSDSEQDDSSKYDTSEAASEADVESNSGEAAGADWVSLTKSSTNIQESSAI